MKKFIIYLSSILLLPVLSCRSENRYNCSMKITEYTEDNVGFMIHGSALENGQRFVSIVHVVNPKDWDYNKYFTGNSFSKNEADEMKVLEKDSCELKQKYFVYLEGLQNRK